jgi:hypothetical protein
MSIYIGDMASAFQGGERRQGQGGSFFFVFCEECGNNLRHSNNRICMSKRLRESSSRREDGG